MVNLRRSESFRRGLRTVGAGAFLVAVLALSFLPTEWLPEWLGLVAALGAVAALLWFLSDLGLARVRAEREQAAAARDRERDPLRHGRRTGKTPAESDPPAT